MKPICPNCNSNLEWSSEDFYYHIDDIFGINAICTKCSKEYNIVFKLEKIEECLL